MPNYHEPRIGALVLILAVAAALAGCDLGNFGSRASEEWTRTYPLGPGGRFEVRNVNGRIAVEAHAGDVIEVRAERVGRGATPAAAENALARIEIIEEVSDRVVRLETRIPSGFRSGGDVRYDVRVPAEIEVRVRTVNGPVRVTGVRAPVEAHTTNGAVEVVDVSGPVEAGTVNGGVNVELQSVPDSGVSLKTTNGGIQLRVPRAARADISARVTNGGIRTGDLPLDTLTADRRHLEGRLNGGGPLIEMRTTNGGISVVGY